MSKQPAKPQQYSQADLNKIVLEYLSKKGYHKTEAMLRQESDGPGGPLNTGANNSVAATATPTTVTTAPKPFQQYPAKASGTGAADGGDRAGTEVSSEIETQSKHPEKYAQGYEMLRGWVDSSLDLYKPELQKFLFPIFVNCYIELIYRESKNAEKFFAQFKDDHLVQHGIEIVELSAISSKDHASISALVKNMRGKKYKVKISAMCLYLLLYFLIEHKHLGGDLLLHIVNQYLDLQITQDKLGANNAAMDGIEGLVDFNEANLAQFNSKLLHLGRFPRDEAFDKELEAELKSRDERKPGKVSLVSEFRKILAQPPNPTVSNSGQGRDNKTSKVVEADDDNDDDIEPQPAANTVAPATSDTIYDKLKKNDPNFDPPDADLLPLPPTTVYDVKRAVMAVQDSRACLSLHKLPVSIVAYTFHNCATEMTCIEFSGSSKNALVAAGFEDSSVWLWSMDGNPLKSLIKNDSHNKDTARRLVGHSGTVYSLTFSPDGSFLVSASEDGTCRVWSLDTFTTLCVYKAHDSPVWDVEFSPVGQYFATVSHDLTARLWSIDHIYPIRVFVGHTSDVDCVAWFPNGCYLFTGSADKTIRMWDIITGESVRLYVGHSAPINCMAVSPSGQLLASAGEDGQILLWDVSSGKLLKRMRGHGVKSSIYSVSFSSDGAILVSGGSDNSVRVWDVKMNVETNTNGDATPDHKGVYFTKKSNVVKTLFTKRNLCMVGAIYTK